jgi:hypothetical protein
LINSEVGGKMPNCVDLEQSISPNQRPGTFSQRVYLSRTKHADHEEPRPHNFPPLSGEDTLSRSCENLLETAPFITVSGPKLFRPLFA